MQCDKKTMVGGMVFHCLRPERHDGWHEGSGRCYGQEVRIRFNDADLRHDAYPNRYRQVVGALVATIAEATTWSDIESAWEALVRVRMTGSQMANEHRHIHGCGANTISDIPPEPAP